MKCPVCNEKILEDSTIFLVNGEIVGCDNCVKELQADEWFDADEFDSQQDYVDDALWQQAKDRRVGIE